MRCLVTGASGHLGSYLTRLLVKQGSQVSVVVRQGSDLWRISDILGQIKLIRADLSNIAQAADAIKAAAPTVVFHLAWHGVTSDCRNDVRQITQNVEGSLKLFEIVQSAGCSRWIGIGSQAEYGPYAVPLKEDLPTKPITTYGVCKLCVGLLIQKICELKGIRYVWIRLLATYGPKDDERHMIPAMISQLLSGDRPLLTPGEQKWDYLYVEDAAEAIYQTALAQEACGVYILGSGKAFTIRSIVERIRDMIDPSLPLGFGEVPYRSDQMMYLQGDIHCLQHATGWAPKVSLDEGLKRTVEWYRSYKHQLVTQ